MKFGRLLQEYEVLEWKGLYLPYGFLKKRLYEIAGGRSEVALRLLETELLGGRESFSAVSAGRGLLSSRPSFNAVQWLFSGGGGGNGNGGSQSLAGVPSSADLAEFSATMPLTEASEPGAEGFAGGAPFSGSYGSGSGGGDGDGDEEAGEGRAAAAAGALSSPAGSAAAAAWRRATESEAMRVATFVDRGLAALREKLASLEHWADEGGGGNSTKAKKIPGGYNLELRQLEVLGRLGEDVSKLRSFSELNQVALFKIFKKYDKVLSTTEGLSSQYPALVARARLDSVLPFDELSARIRGAFLKSSPCKGLEASLEVARLAAGLSSQSKGHRGPGLGQTWTVQFGERLLYFFLGLSVALFVAIIILIAIPPANQKTFSTGYFMANFCVFRVVLSITLAVWGVGTVARVCEDNHINHCFLLGVDPRCHIGPNFLFVAAASLSSLWIMLFGMYIIDYKWMVLPEVMSKSGYNKRSNVLFMLYPSILLLSTICLAIWPSHTCRNRYKKAVLQSVGRTCLAPLYSVSFADNLVGDVLTSLAKPLQEVPATLCYLWQYHPLPKDAVEKFVLHGNTCPQWEQSILAPMIAGAPFLFRLMQCARRFADTQDSRHLWNLGKYTASLLVIIVTSTSSSTGLIIVVSTIATLYAAVWDVFLDWGLGLPGISRLWSRARQRLSPASCEAWSALPVSPPLLMEEDREDKGAKPGETLAAEQRRFSVRFYWLAIIFDVAARSTWVLTLMPVTLLSDDIVQRALLQTWIASTEIARRTLWAILRIENEQVTNASGFREFLWVPWKMNSAEGTTTSASSAGASKEAAGVLALAVPLLAAGPALPLPLR